MARLKPITAWGDLNERRARVKQVFLQLLDESDLLRMLGRRDSWAIVGGAVRDTMLRSDFRLPRLVELWPDIDVAVSVSVWGLPVVRGRGWSRKRTLALNHFGGVKIETSPLGALDLWTWAKPRGGPYSVDDWFNQLHAIDFGLNAVAFVWPECEVIVHPQWEADLGKRQVEKLAPESPQREVQAVRSIALKVKLERVLGARIELGKEAQQDVAWLVRSAKRHEAVAALEYLKQKTDSSRWPLTTAEAFLRVSRALHPSSVFLNAILDVYGNRFPRIRPRKNGLARDISHRKRRSIRALSQRTLDLDR